MAETIIDHLRKDHDTVRDLFGRLEQTAAAERRELFREIVSELARHEAAEQAIVHPRTREAAHGDQVADSVIGEEQEAEELMADMESMDPESDEFLAAFRKLHTAVENHATHEEEKEFPRLEEQFDHDELVAMATHFERLESVAPTRPHPNTPNDPVATAAIGPVAGVFDRARDAVRDALGR
ncbi:hemerythrin domain-containing protein [Salsipaludibacter albus]|uniref:hemerythrin domain-containing protein n=1 Tax=Salsipaludibacter albus TaxID=2849650 RepID=UPI001EE4E78F|nr:hemerythrin domain-containing protein [Salsipaludibacter albus]MBY5161396.1 hemerythrin domain-containing protein [Salsipaludibacter albus]